MESASQGPRQPLPKSKGAILSPAAPGSAPHSGHPDCLPGVIFAGRSGLPPTTVCSLRAETNAYVSFYPLLTLMVALTE